MDKLKMLTSFKYLTLFSGAIFGIALSAYGYNQQWNSYQQVSIASSIAMITIFSELFLFLLEIKSEINRYMPWLNKTAQDVEHQIALSEYRNAEENLKLAFSGTDFICSDILKANTILLENLVAGQEFKALTMLTNPELWEIDDNLRNYLKLNIKKAGEGVIIERIFIFDNEEQMKKMQSVIQQQTDANIKIYSIMSSELYNTGGYNNFFKSPDFSIAQNLHLALYVEAARQLNLVWVTTNQDKINSLNTQFLAMLSILRNR